MRREKELWQLVLSRQDLFWSGLCNWVYKLLEKRIINENEFVLLKNVMTCKLPERFGSAYSWIPCDIQPRINWINERIKQLENETI